MINLLIFDFDGLILDTETATYEVYRAWFKKQKGLDLEIADYLTCVGSHFHVLLDHLKHKYGLDVDADTFAKDVQTDYVSAVRNLPARPGLVHFIKEASKAGYGITLCTSSKREKPLFQLERLGLLEYFDHLVCADDVKHIKPQPDLFLKALELNQSQAGSALVFEDSGNGLLAARRAGIAVVVVPNTITQYSAFEGALAKIESFEHISVSDIEKWGKDLHDC